jgi:transcriptional regulator with XRE-family HTH domain
MSKDTQFLDPIAEQMIRARRTQRLTQEEVATAAGISRRALIMIEAGGDCSLSTLRRIFTVLNMELVAKVNSRPTLEDLDREHSEEFAARSERPQS